MSRLVSVFAATLLSLCWQISVEGVYVDIPVQLAVSGDDYFAFGSINGDLHENVRYAVMLCCTCMFLHVTSSYDLLSGRFTSSCLTCGVAVAAPAVQQTDLG